METDEPKFVQSAPAAAATKIDAQEEKVAESGSSSNRPRQGVGVHDLAAGVGACAASAGSKRKSVAAPDASSSSAQSDEAHSSPASATHASGPPSNAHLASVLESPAAAAPVAKRTRRAQQLANSRAASLVASSMLRLLDRDSGARQSLMQMLPVKDLVSLLRSGRSWREWIEGSPSSVGSQQIELRGKSLASFAKCGWVHRVVQDLRFSDSGGGELAQFMPCLARLPRLRSLHLFSDDNSADEDLLREFFSAVAGTLKHLYVYHCPEDSEGVPALWSALDVLTGLESLTFGTTVHSDHLDFAFLPSMTQLERFHLYDEGRGQRCSAEQFEWLSQCKALTDLQCGQFLPSWEIGPKDPQGRQALIDHGLSRLVRRRAENGAVPLRHLYLGPDSVIDPMGWQVLSQQCTELEEIESSVWSPALTPADWLRLANFPQLHRLQIGNLFDDDSPLDMGRVSAALIHCRALRSLSLCYVQLRAEHVTVLASLPALESFDGYLLRVESLAPLSTAPALSKLRLVKCTGINGDAINIREMIPPMLLVSKLTIEDQLSEAEVEPSVVALLQRLPRLTRAGLSRW